MSRAIKMLLEKRWIARGEYDAAMIASTRCGETPGYHLVAADAIADDDLVNFFLRYFSLKFWPRFKLKNIPRSTIEILSPALAKHLRVLPVKAGEGNLTLGITDPSLTHVAEEAAFHTKRFVNPVLLSETDMTWALRHYYDIVSYGAGPAVPNSRAAKQHATLERETHDIMKSPETDHTDLPERVTRISNVVKATDAGWDIDEWESPPRRPVETDAADDVIPLLTPSIGNRDELHPRLSRLPTVQPEPRDWHHASEQLLKHRNTLPPPTLVPSSPPERSAWSRPPVPQAARSSLFSAPPPPPESEPPSQPPAPEPAATQTISEILGAINRTGDRDEIVALALDHLLLFSRRAAFLLVKRNEIRGFEIKGENANRTAFKAYWVPIASASTFRTVATEGEIHLGPLGRTATDAIFTAAVGGRPRRVLVIPVQIQNRIVALLYADNLKIDMPPWNLLERLADVVGGNLERLILARVSSAR